MKRLFGRSKEEEKDEFRADNEWQKYKSVIDQIFKDTESHREKMTRNINVFRGKVWDEEKLDSYDSRASYNMIFTTVESIAPLITDSKPITSLVPLFPYMEKVAWSYNNAIKYGYEVLDVTNQLYHWVLWSMLCGTGIMKMYFDPVKGETGELRMEMVDPRDFFIAPGYTDLWEAPFCGVKTRKPVSWVKETFPDVELKKGEVDSYAKKDAGEKEYKYSDASAVDRETSFVTVYEVWARDPEVMIETDENGDEKEVKKWPYGKLVYFTDKQLLGCLEAVDKHGYPPYVELHDYINPGMFTGISEADQIMGLHTEMNIQLQSLSAWTRGHGRKNYVVDSNSGIDADQVKRDFHKGGQIWSYDRRQTDNPIKVIDDGTINPDIYQFSKMIIQIVSDVTGVQDITKGRAGKRERQSASEIAILSDSANTRTRQRIRNLEWSIKRMTYLMVKLQQEHYTEERFIRTSKDGVVQYERFSSSREGLDKIMRPPQKLFEKLDQEDWMKDFESQTQASLQQMYEPDELAMMKDYLAFSKQYSMENAVDPIYFPFDIEIQTNSTLPMDKQSLANLGLNLRRMKVIDNEAVLDLLDFPNGKGITERMKKQAAAAAAAKRGGM